MSANESYDEFPLWSTTATPALTVSELTAAVREVLESAFPDEFAIQGEVSNFKHHTSGHMYFSLKDEKASLRCVFFHADNARVRFTPADGLKVLARGTLGLYPPQGTYQLYVKSLAPAGEGELMAALERLKQKLSAEGLFDAERKRPLPKYPARVGVITSATGAAVRDIFTVLTRRWPGITVVLRPTQVQGAAAADVAAAVAAFNSSRAADVLIIGRGGGSLEDLWAFNEEIAVRAIAASRIPTISAVGHEVDWTLADLAADLRAATPSAAAEMAVPLKTECAGDVNRLRRELADAATERVNDARNDVEDLRSSFGFRLLPQRIAERRQGVDETAARAARAASVAVAVIRNRYAEAANTLRALSPRATLARGYAVATKNGAVIKTAAALAADDRLAIHFRDGARDAVITDDPQGAPGA